MSKKLMPVPSHVYREQSLPNNRLAGPCWLAWPTWPSATLRCALLRRATLHTLTVHEADARTDEWQEVRAQLSEGEPSLTFAKGGKKALGHKVASAVTNPGNLRSWRSSIHLRTK